MPGPRGRSERAAPVAWLVPTKAMDIEVLSKEFCHHAQYMLGYSPDTTKRYRSNIRLLQRSMQLSEISQCTDADVREFFHHGRVQRHWTSATFTTCHKSLLVFFRWCVRHGHLPSNPADEIELPKAEKALPSRLTEANAERLLEAAESYPYPYAFLRYRNHAIVAVLLFAGLRKSELMHLRLIDVEVENRTIFVRRGKGAKDRIVPIGPRLAAILSRYVVERKRLGKTCPEFFASLNRDMGITDQALKGLVALLRRSTGLTFTIHKLRHSFATLMLEGGCDIFSLSKMMGHSDIKTTTIYLAASPEHLRAQIAKHPLGYV